MNKPGISICIPAYKRVQYLKRLLESIVVQTYRDFEVVITDDSDDDSVGKLVEEYKLKLPVVYHKNQKPFGTPANWNFAISKANGKWIKLMHDDDWFANEKTLEIFSQQTKKGKEFIFCAYSNVFKDRQPQKVFFPSSWRKEIIKNPVILLSRNVIGPPSVTLIHQSIIEKYDEQLKWRVDIEYYMRILKEKKDFEYINELLVNVGIDDTQVTNSCKDHPDVEIPEGLVLIMKHGITPLKTILVYDAWWRILRNVRIRSPKELLHYAPSEKWPGVIFKMINHQHYIPYSFLKFGPISKIAMTISYLLNRKYL